MSCVLVCPEGYQANPQSGSCQQNCSHSLYDFEPAHLCVESCPKPYYGYDNDTEKICVIECPEGFFAYDDICKDSCSGTGLYADSVTHRCVAECINDTYASDSSSSCVDSCAPYSEFADNSTNTCVDECPTDPDYYEENDICVMHCSGSLFADPTTGIRSCVGECQ